MTPTDKQPALDMTPDGKVKTTNQVVIGLITCSILGTVYFLGVLWSIRDLKNTTEAYQKTTDARIRYLFRATDTPDPWEGEARAATSALPRTAAPAP